MLFVMMASFLHAQILNAKVGVNGLTCSQCSRSVEMQLRKLPFVKDVSMNLEQTEGTLQFKTGTRIDFSKIAKAVNDAGFSVRFLNANIDMDKVALAGNGFKIGDDYFHFTQDTNMRLQGTKAFRFLGKTYSSQKQDAKVPETKVAGVKGRVYNVSQASTF